MLDRESACNKVFLARRFFCSAPMELGFGSSPLVRFQAGRCPEESCLIRSIRRLSGKRQNCERRQARSANRSLSSTQALTPELDAALSALRQHPVMAMLVLGDPFFDTNRNKIITFAAQQKLPAMYHFRERG